MNMQRGFTLIELLVVISIISLLSTVVISQTREARLRAENAQITQDARQWMMALERYGLDNGKYWGDASIAGNESSNVQLICLGLPCNGQSIAEDTGFKDSMAKYIPYINPNRKAIRYSLSSYGSYIFYQNDDYINQVTLLYFLNGNANCLAGTEKNYDPTTKNTLCYKYYVYKIW
ncbi:MAG: type II secretion system protein [Candidatus Shapirobacteria bacterium]